MKVEAVERMRSACHGEGNEMKRSEQLREKGRDAEDQITRQDHHKVRREREIAIEAGRER